MKISIKLLVTSFVILLCFCPSDIVHAASEYIGYNSQGGLSSTLSPSYCWGNKYSTDTYAATGSEVVDSFIVWCNPQNNNNKIVFGIYTVVGGAISSKVYVSDTLTLTGSGISRWAQPANCELISGNTYTLCLDISGSVGPAVCYSVLTNGLSRNNSASFPSTWSDDLSNNLRYSVAAHYSIRNNGNTTRRRLQAGGEK